jgi:CBS domain-containing protein
MVPHACALPAQHEAPVAVLTGSLRAPILHRWQHCDAASSPGESRLSTNAKVQDLMVEKVISVEPHHTVEHVRSIMERNKIHAVPVVGVEGEPLGMVSSVDLAAGLKAATPINKIMTSDKIYSIPQYDDVSTAARVMRNHHIHHLVVTHEQKVVGIISSFDLLKLVEGHRFVAKNAPTPSKRKGSKRE